nr:MAG: ORF1 [Torque teno polar bear virus 48]
MPYRRRRRRIPRRRSQLHYRRRRWIRKGRRRWHWRRGRRYSTVRVTRPRHVRPLIVRGVEILGVQGSQVNFNLVEGNNAGTDDQWVISIKNVAPANREVDYFSTIFPDSTSLNDSCKDKWNSKTTAYWNFVGGYGQAEFTFRSLVFRTILGLARFSSKLDGFQYIKFLGYHFTLMRTQHIDYVFFTEGHRGPRDYEKTLLHPLNLLNTPGSVLVQSLQRSKCCRTPRVKKRADPTIFGWHDIEDFLGVRLTGYVWSVIELDHPMGKNPNVTKDQEAPITNEWMNETNEGNKQISTYCPKWMNRVEYDKDFVDKIDKFQLQQKQNWWDFDFEGSLTQDHGNYAPFLPPMIAADTPQTLWFRYTFLFQIAGKSFGYRRVIWPLREADVCTPCFPRRTEAYEETCDACIHPEDTDPHGQLKKSAFKRITGSPQYRKRRALAFLAHLIRQRRKRKRVKWADQEKQTSKRRRTFSR